MVALGEQAVEMPFAPGDVIAGKYEVIKLIGSGGMGYVVSAMHIELGEVVAHRRDQVNTVRCTQENGGR